MMRRSDNLSCWTDLDSSDHSGPIEVLGVSLDALMAPIEDNETVSAVESITEMHLNHKTASSYSICIKHPQNSMFIVCISNYNLSI